MFKKLKLFSKTEMKVLAVISIKDGEFYEKQIAKESRVSVGSAHAILNKFARLNFVKKKKKGRMSFYQRNDENPVLRQYKVFITVNKLSEMIKKLKPISKRIILFGSCAEGRNNEKSDIDIFILSNEKDEIREIIRTNEKIQAIILNTVEYSTLRRKDKPLYERINMGIELSGDGDG